MTKLPSEIRDLLRILRRIEGKAIAALESRPLRSAREALDVYVFATLMERIVLELAVYPSLPRRTCDAARKPRGRRRMR